MWDEYRLDGIRCSFSLSRRESDRGFGTNSRRRRVVATAAHVPWKEIVGTAVDAGSNSLPSVLASGVVTDRRNHSQRQWR